MLQSASLHLPVSMSTAWCARAAGLAGEASSCGLCPYSVVRPPLCAALPVMFALALESTRLVVLALSFVVVWVSPGRSGRRERQWPRGEGEVEIQTIGIRTGFLCDLEVFLGAFGHGHILGLTLQNTQSWCKTLVLMISLSWALFCFLCSILVQWHLGNTSSLPLP
jgi:hypothetical protein